jgi:hypothetical protein
MTQEQSHEPSALPPSHPAGDAAHAIFAAVAQIGLALRDSHGPVEDLGLLLANLSETLIVLRSAPLGQGAEHSAPAAVVRGLIEQLQTDVFKAVQRLQFYDRLEQHLSHLQKYLICVANELSSVKTEAEARELWTGLHARLRERLISDDQRGLLDLFLTPDAGTRVSAQLPRPELLQPGSTELF